jgi:hypothetical protein
MASDGLTQETGEKKLTELLLGVSRLAQQQGIAEEGIPVHTIQYMIHEQDTARQDASLGVP